MHILTMEYKNWRGETRVRRVMPIRIWYGSTQWHPEKQWLLEAHDTEDYNYIKNFALKDVIKFL